MASGGEDISATFKLFATKAEKKEATSKDATKWFTDAKLIGKSCSSNSLDIAFSKVKTKGKTTITLDQMKKLVTEMAKSYKVDKKLGSDGEAEKQMLEKLAAATPKGHGTTKTTNEKSVNKMTDTSKYTGAHKERFDASGKGKGLEGRADIVENKGYVGNYKGEGTYDKK